MPSVEVVPSPMGIADREDVKEKHAQSGRSPSALEAISAGGVVLRGPPTFNSYEKQRRWMLEHMAGAFRVFARRGFAEGLAGHISLRDPEHPNYFWTNPLGRHFALVKVSDLILLNESGKPVGGNLSQPANAAGFLIHSHLHKRYPQVNAACHTHSINGRAWSTFGKRLEMINQDVCDFYGDAHAVYSDFNGVVLDEEEGENLALALGNNGRGLILQNHGLLTVGKTVDEAAYLFTLMEKCCEAQLKVEAAAAGGLEKKIVSDKAARYTYQSSTDPDSLYAEFQPDYELELELSGGSFLH